MRGWVPIDRFVPWLGAAWAILLGLGGCAEDADAADAGVEPVPVAVVSPAQGAAGGGGIWTAGLLEPHRRASPSTRLSGTVTAVEVREGDTVQQGELLARVDARSLDARVRSARAAVGAAGLGLEEARKNLGRMQRLYERDLVERLRYEEARMAVAKAEGELAQAQAAFEESQTTRSYAEVRAPLDATVVQILSREGDFAAPGKPMLVLEDRSSLKVVSRISDETARTLQVGDEVAVRIPSAGREAQGRVLAVLPFGEPRAPGFRVEVAIDNEALELQPGASANVRVPGGTGDGGGGLYIPAGSLVRRGHLRGVYVAAAHDDAGTAARAQLRWLVLEDPEGSGDRVRVLSGLEPQDRVIVDPAPSALGAGQAIVVRERPSGTGEGP